MERKICISRICTSNSEYAMVRWQVEQEYGDGGWIVIDTFSTFKDMRYKYPYIHYPKVYKSCECDYEDARNPRCMYAKKRIK